MKKRDDTMNRTYKGIKLRIFRYFGVNKILEHQYIVLWYDRYTRKWRKMCTGNTIEYCIRTSEFIIDNWE